jgi:hypothetical protein
VRCGSGFSEPIAMTMNEEQAEEATGEPPRALPKRRQWFSIGHFCVWLIFGAIFYVGDELDRLFSLWLLLVPVIAIPALIALLTFVIGLAANLWTRRWWRLISVVAAPTLTIGLLAASIRYQFNADWVHFQLTRGYYMQVVSTLPETSPKYHQWNWGETGGAIGPNIIYTLVYDETDTPLDHPRNPGSEGGVSTARPYGHHFYLITDTFQ